MSALGRLSDGYERGATLKVDWRLEESPDPQEVRPAGQTTNGLIVRRRLCLESNMLRTVATLENTSAMAAEAMLHTRWDFRPIPIDELAIHFQSQDGSRTDRPIIRLGDPVIGELPGRPAGEWELRSTAGALLVANSFDPLEVSPQTVLPPGAKITLRSDYCLP